jgi:hypothetical protein
MLHMRRRRPKWLKRNGWTVTDLSGESSDLKRRKEREKERERNREKETLRERERERER